MQRTDARVRNFDSNVPDDSWFAMSDQSHVDSALSSAFECASEVAGDAAFFRLRTDRRLPVMGLLRTQPSWLASAVFAIGECASRLALKSA